MNEIQSLLFDLLSSDEEETFEDRFLNFLVMEHFVSKLRNKGLSNKDIWRICLELDDEK
jgi:hypothetical protein